MVKIAITLLCIGSLVLIYAVMDHSKNAAIERARKAKKVKDSISNKIITPVEEKITEKAGEKRVSKKELSLKKAGLRMNFAQNILVCLFLGLCFAVFSFIFSKNIFLSIIMFACGWALPSLIITFITNRRLDVLDKQVGDFMCLLVDRYDNINNFRTALITTVEDFEGRDPLYPELITMLTQIETGEPTADVLHDLAKRTDNKYLDRLASYYEVTADVGTEEARHVVLEQAVTDYENDLELNRRYKSEISSVTSETYIMLAFIPAEIIYEINMDDTYIDFMTKTTLGQIGTGIIVAGWILIFWYTTVRLGRPINRGE